MSISYSFHLSNKGHSVTNINKIKSVSRHNLRRFKNAENYNQNEIEILVGSDSILDDIKKIYHQEFNDCLAKYNSKQSRNDRKIKNYLEHISNSRTDVASEIIIQLGDMEFWKDKTAEEKRKMKYIFKDQVKYLQEVLPNFKIASAVIHYDENSPHLHLVGVPIADNYKNGLEKQVAKTKVFNKKTLENLQNIMRQRAQKGIELNHDLFGDEFIKDKEKGRNKDLPKTSLSEYYRLKAQNDDLSKKMQIQEENYEKQQKIVQKLKMELTRLEEYIVNKQDFLNQLEKDYDDMLKNQEIDYNHNNDIIQRQEQTIEQLSRDISDIPNFIGEYKDRLSHRTVSLLEKFSETPSKNKSLFERADDWER